MSNYPHPIFRHYLEEEDDKPYYKMNSLSFYYEDMERKQKLIESLAKSIAGYDIRLTENLETIEKEVDRRLADWDKQLERFPDSVEGLLSKWSTDGTIDTVIQTALIDEKIEPLTVKLAETTTFIGEPLTKFLLSGEVVPNDGEINAHTILQRAVNALGDLFEQDGTPRQLVLPKGKYKQNAAIQWRSGVGIRGVSREETTLLPYGAVSAIIARQSEPEIWYENCHFADFTIDGVHQNSQMDDFMVKAIYIQFIKHSRFERLNIKNIWMTGLGIDWVDDVWIADCYLDNCGRGGNVSRGFGSGAGIGIATGYQEIESCTIINCVSTNNRTHGFFTETSADRPNNSKGFKLIGCSASGNVSGFCDSGSKNAIISGCFFEGNTNGVLVRPGRPLGPNGMDGNVTGCLIANNTADGIVLMDMYDAGYQITNNQIVENGASGIIFRIANENKKIKPTTIKGNVIKRNGERGIIFAYNAVNVERPLITDNEIADNGMNGDPTKSEAIRIIPKLTYPTFSNNRIYNTEEGFQKDAIVFDSEIVSPIFTGNEIDVLGNFLSGSLTKITSFKNIKNNIERATEEKILASTWFDDFDRSDSTILSQNVPSGVGTWELNTLRAGNDYTAEIKNGELSVTGDTVYAFITNSFANGVLEATCSSVGVNHQAKIAGRIGGELATNIVLKARVSSSDFRWCIAERINGSDNIIAILDKTSEDGDVLKIIFDDANISVYINGQFKSAIITSLTTPYTKFGVLSTKNENDILWEDIGFTPIV